LLAVVMFAMVFAAVPVFAENSYVSLRAGAFSPNSDDNGLKDFDTGYNIEIAYGYKIMPNFAVEGGIGRYSTKREESVSGTSYGVDYSDSFSVTASVIPITATAKGILPIADGKFELYGGAGLGYYLASSEYESKTEFEGYPELSTSTSGSDSANAFGFHVVGGADFNISETIAVGGEAKWFSVEPDFGGGSVKMGGIIFNAGVKYKF